MTDQQPLHGATVRLVPGPALIHELVNYNGSSICWLRLKSSLLADYSFLCIPILMHFFGVFGYFLWYRLL